MWGVSPEILIGRAPTISMELLLAADIFMLTGMRCCLERPRGESREVPARQDWHPVSAIAGTEMVGVGSLKVLRKPRSLVSVGSAQTETSTKGWGSDVRFSHAWRNSLNTWCSRVIAWAVLVGESLMLHKTSKVAEVPSSCSVTGACVVCWWRCGWRQTLAWWCRMPHLLHLLL